MTGANPTAIAIRKTFTVETGAQPTIEQFTSLNNLSAIELLGRLAINVAPELADAIAIAAAQEPEPGKRVIWPSF